MSYPERKPIYDAYKIIVQKIIDSKEFKEYASSEIDALDQSLLDAFKEIGGVIMTSKKWEVE